MATVVAAGQAMFEAENAAPSATPPAAAGVFDPADLQPAPGLMTAIEAWLIRHPLWLMAALRRWRPVAMFRGMAIVTRYDDVVGALRSDRAIAVPFADQVRALNDGPNFLLGMADGADYRWLRSVVLAAFPPSDAGIVVGPVAAREASAIVAGAGGRIEVIQQLVTRVPTRICELYYGVPVADPLRFGQITIAMSTYMFGGPQSDKVRAAALAAGAELRAIVDAAIVAARAAPPETDTVAARLVRAQPDEPRLTDAIVRGCLIGMITGFVPTNTMAGGHIVEVLLGDPAMLRAAQDAAAAGDDDLLCRCLFEAMRFYPLNPGMFRVCAEDFTFASGATVRAGTPMLISTQSAMFDPRRVTNPNAFDPARPPEDYLLFGHGLHWCTGASLARAQITQTFKPLLLQRNLRRAPGRAGRTTKLGPFPAGLTIDYDPPATV